MNTPAVASTKSVQAVIVEKLLFAGQLVIFICTFGFAFPNLLQKDDLGKQIRP